MRSLLDRLKHHSMMVLCIAACAIPLVAILFVGWSSSTSWLLLLPCMVMHLVMMKMMGNKACHGHEKDTKSISNPKPSTTLEA